MWSQVTAAQVTAANAQHRGPIIFQLRTKSGNRRPATASHLDLHPTTHSIQQAKTRNFHRDSQQDVFRFRMVHTYPELSHFHQCQRNAEWYHKGEKKALHPTSTIAAVPPTACFGLTGSISLLQKIEGAKECAYHYLSIKKGSPIATKQGCPPPLGLTSDLPQLLSHQARSQARSDCHQWGHRFTLASTSRHQIRSNYRQKLHRAAISLRP